MKRRLMFPIMLELLGIAMIGSGVGVEIAMHAEVGYVLISVGSVMVAGGGVIWGKFVRGSRGGK